MGKPMTPEIIIGNAGGDHVSLKIGRRDDEGWSPADIEVCCDGWEGRLKGSFLKGELSNFAKEIRSLLGNLSGTAGLHPVEPNVSMTLAGDGKGHIVVKGLAQNTFGSGNQFNFCFEIDQTYLTKIVNSLLAADPI